MNTTTRAQTMQATQRTYTNVETGHTCRLYTSNDASKYHLIYEGNTDSAPADGNEVIGFYLAAHTAVTVKTNKGRLLSLDTGQFLPLTEGERVTHRKVAGLGKFTKI